jgi:hypothetical protein
MAKNLPLLIFSSRETVVANGYFFFAAADLAARAALFCALALLALDCFCEDFFWLDFGDLSPIILFFRGLTGLRNFSFSEGKGIMRATALIVNSRCEIILVWNFSTQAIGRVVSGQKIFPDTCCYPAKTSDAVCVC